MTEEFKRLMVFGDWAHYYLTMSARYQADIARSLGRFVERGLVYKGKKPVHWCIHCRTALAEAEVEYAGPHVALDLRRVPAHSGKRSGAGRARARARRTRRLGSHLDDDTVDDPVETWRSRFIPNSTTRRTTSTGSVVIVAEGLAAAVAPERQAAVRRAVARMKGETLEGLRFRHPLYERDSVAVLADYVTLDQGTGAVHTAPGHGADDFLTGVKYGLDIYAPIGPGGHFLDTVELFAGQRVFDANPNVEEALHERSRLWHREIVLAPVPALLALPQSGDLSRHVAVVRSPGRRGRRSPCEDGQAADAA